MDGQKAFTGKTWIAASTFIKIPSRRANRLQWSIACGEVTVNTAGFWIVERRALRPMARSSVTSALCIDITERKGAEEKFRLVLDAAPNAMIMVDPVGVINFANPSAATVFGYSLSELIGCQIEMLIPKRFRDRHPGYRKDFSSHPSGRAMGVGRDLFGRRKDGSEFPVEVGLSPMRTTRGVFVLASLIDITARKAAEEEARRRREQVELLCWVSLLGEMTASLAHELNQPLGGDREQRHRRDAIHRTGQARPRTTTGDSYRRGGRRSPRP